MRKSMEHRVVREVMTRAPKSVGPKTDVRTLKAMFEMYEFDAFPVVDDQQVLLGVVTNLDFLRMFRLDEARRWIPDLRTLWAERVEDIMNPGLVPVGPEDPIELVVDGMVRWTVRSVPVTSCAPMRARSRWTACSGPERTSPSGCRATGGRRNVPEARVLVVDDDAEVVSLLEQDLTACGSRSSPPARGRPACASCERRRWTRWSPISACRTSMDCRSCASLSRASPTPR